jgi:hypothetical protein
MAEGRWRCSRGGGARPLGGLEHQAGATPGHRNRTDRGLETVPDAQPRPTLHRNTINTAVSPTQVAQLRRREAGVALRNSTPDPLHAIDAWSCPAFVDTLVMRRVLVMDAGARSRRVAVVEGGVATLAVVEDLDEVEHHQAQRIGRSPAQGHLSADG